MPAARRQRRQSDIASDVLRKLGKDVLNAVGDQIGLLPAVVIRR